MKKAVTTKTIRCECSCGCDRDFTWEKAAIKRDGPICWWCRRDIHLGPPKRRRKR